MTSASASAPTAALSPAPSFAVTAQHGQARCGIIRTAHGDVHTPAFLFCATQGVLKSLDTPTLARHDVQILLANTYHLMIQPGADLVEEMGGLHGFMGWNGPLFTDSGGYQIFSLRHGSVSNEIKGRRQQPKSSKNHRDSHAGSHSVKKESSDLSSPPKSLVKVTPQGAHFRSHRDGTPWLLTPEKSIEIQCKLGVDLMCVLDECTPLHLAPHKTRASMMLSHAWASRCLEAFDQRHHPHQGLYGIVQGGIYPDLRQESIDFITRQPFFGHAIGGSLGADKTQMRAVVGQTVQNGKLRGKPIHLLGIGGLSDIFSGVLMGIDTFDCVSPTRLGRHGCALIQPHYWHQAQEPYHLREHVNLSRECFRADQRPIDERCPCQTCQTYSRGYLHHLLKAKEITALSAISLHNVSFMTRFMTAIRQGICTGDLRTVAHDWLSPVGIETLDFS